MVELLLGLAVGSRIWAAGAMPKLKNLDEIRVLMDAVKDHDRCMHEVANARSSDHLSPDVREGP